MVCKAAIMGDAKSFEKIVNSTDPMETKKLGRAVFPWDSDKWNSVVVPVANDIMFQKFSKVPGFKKILLGTKCAVLAETTADDTKWAIGVGWEDPKAKQPWMWANTGTNILGWALMNARDKLNGNVSIYN